MTGSRFEGLLPAPRAVLLLLPLLLAGCGVTYISSRVSDRTEGLDVRVVPVTMETVLVANSQPYAPQSLPAAFHQAAGPGDLRGAGALPDAPQFPAITPGTLELRAPPPVASTPYRIGTGDVLRMATALPADSDPLRGATSGSSALQDMTVRDDGAVSVPQVGVVNVAGLTIDEAEALLFRRLIESGIDPQFSLEVAGFNSQLITVGGAVGGGAVLPLTLTPPTLAQALVLAGGIAVTNPEFASIRIYRDGSLYQIPLAEFRARPELQGLRTVAGDAIYVDTTYDLERAQAFYESQINVIALRRSGRAEAVAEMQAEMSLRQSLLADQRELFQARATLGAEARDYVYLAGEVSRQNRWPLPYDQQASLADVLYDNGGFDTQTGNPAHIYVLRASTNPAAFGAVTAWHLDARNAAAFTLAPRFQMRPDDIIFIEEQPVTRWNRAMQQSIPSLISTAASVAGQ